MGYNVLPKMIKVVSFVLACAAVANAQSLLVTPKVDYVDNSAPTPYQFSYTAPAEGGSSSHEETGDGYGRVSGTYTVQDDDGRQRIVRYVADEGGFRASISTNEPGTANQNPADVIIESSADDGFDGGHVLHPTPVAVAPAVPIAPVAPVAIEPAIPVAPVAPVAVAPLPVRRQNYVPIRPNLVPLQPTLFPVQPEIRRFVAPPSLLPFDTRRFVPRFEPFAPRRIINAPALVPIHEARIIPDPFFRSLDREFHI